MLIESAELEKAGRFRNDFDKVSKIAQSIIPKHGIVPVFPASKGGVSIMTGTSKHRILVVDDEPSIRECIAILLSEAGYEVTTAEHGFDALSQLRSVAPAVIISDLNMPQMSGFELLSILRDRFPHILVIAVSGAYAPSDSVPSGVIADAFWAKGQHPDGLLHTIDELIRTSASDHTARSVCQRLATL